MSNIRTFYLPGRQKVIVKGTNPISIGICQGRRGDIYCEDELCCGGDILCGRVSINAEVEFLDVPHLNSDIIRSLIAPGVVRDSIKIALAQLWLTLYWYFQLPEPPTELIPGKKGGPRGAWRVRIDTTEGSIFSYPEGLEAAAATGLLSFSSSSPTAPLECYAARSVFWQVPPDYFMGILSRTGSGIDTQVVPLKYPKPGEYTITSGIRHPLRPRPSTTEDLYSRWIPSLKEYLIFRLANAEKDAELLHRWMNDPRVAEFWGEDGGDVEKTRGFLKKGLESQHCYPIIGCWNGEPFGYFEVYWVKEDSLGKFVTDCDNWDRGVHCLVGEQKFRGPHRVGVWVSSLVHYMFLDDPRTQTVMLEPRVDNEKFIKYLTEAGFYKEKEFAFPHKQAALVKLKREAWDGPLL